MGMIEDAKTFRDRHLKSFAKTYLTVFLTLYLRDIVAGSEGGDIDIFDMAVIIPALKWSFISVLRNVYKLLTEK